MNSQDTQIGEVLGRYGEPFAGNVWRVQGTAVIYHKALERIAGTAGITFDPPTVLRAERDEAVILVTGHLTAGERHLVEWSIGEALVNVNYRVSGKQAAYVYAMAEKRAKDRVILKLIGLHGLVYSEEEADEFKGRASPEPETPAAPAKRVPLEKQMGPQPDPKTPAPERDPLSVATGLIRLVNTAASVGDLSAYQTRPKWGEAMAWLDIEAPKYAEQVRAAVLARRDELDPSEPDDLPEHLGGEPVIYGNQRLDGVM